ncbi:glycine/sarcosine/betaine reductase selenoprotein B family protein [Rossellomorea sp. BNER]|uniref:glycine/sarcosine/betaine reductase selenoprotein B family protein n=1 Tax=Rossellomorea sp. BNER TaxID=2962031 RepID=UPI003AF2CFE6|nr:glycine/sarcosine/betaine reductase selenoprotein B family protein [Rossellomorea sp. BNER]
MTQVPSSTKVGFLKRMVSGMARSKFSSLLLEKFPWVYDRFHIKMSKEWSSELPWAPLKKPISASRVALVTTGGIILKSQPPFDLNDSNGDCSYRIIPEDAPLDETVISHLYYDHSDVKIDLEVMFPLNTLHRLQHDGKIRSVAPRHFSFQGGITNPEPLVRETAPEVARHMKNDQVDLAILTPA